MMRGYRQLQRARKLGAIRNMKIELASVHFDQVTRLASSKVFGPDLRRAELIVRQVLLLMLSRPEFNSLFLSAVGSRGVPIAGPLPPEWRHKLAEKGFRVAVMRSRLKWSFAVATAWAYGVGVILKTLARGLRAAVQAESVAPRSYAYFDSLTAVNLPQEGSDGRSHDIFNWYACWKERAEGIETLAHGVPGAPQKRVGKYEVSFLPLALPAPATQQSLLRFARWASVAITQSLTDALRGRWWHALLLGDAARAAAIRFQEPRWLAREYLFQANWIYRPMWTYEAERKGSSILFYFYSTNSEGFKGPDGYADLDFHWRFLSWSRYLVWDEFQAAFLRRGIGPVPAIDVVGPIWFSTSGCETPTTTTLTIAAFDVQPVRSSMYRALALEFDYYTPENCNRFLRDIESVARTLGMRVLWKRKREIGRHAHVQYRIEAKNIASSDAVLPVDPQTAAYRVIECATVVVSMPFTSTALIGLHLGKPSCYYDVTGVLHPDDVGTHGVTLIQGRDQLLSWVSRQIHDASHDVNIRAYQGIAT